MSEQIRIIYPKKRSDFAFQYDCEFRPQPGGIEVDPEEKTLGVYCNGNINGTPEDVYHGRRLWFRINDPMHTTIAEIKALIDEVKPYAERICAGYDTEWDGNNWVGSLNDDAEEAAQSIAQIVGEFYPDFNNGLFDEENEEDDEEENNDEDEEYECEIYTGDDVLKFKTIDDARFYFFNHYTYGERKRIIQENRYNSDFPDISAEYELIINDVGVKFNTYKEARERYFSLSEEERAKVDEDTYHEGNPFYEKLAKENN